MRRGLWAASLVSVFGAIALRCAAQPQPTFSLAAPVKLPFESVNGLIVFSARINGSPPLSIVLDTGAKPGLVDLDRAKELSLRLRGSVRVSGTGPDASPGALVDDAALALDVLPGFASPVTVAVPLAAISRRVGQRLDGIVGADFIRAFVVEVDYEAKTIVLHDARSFTYRGSGPVIAAMIDRNGHPTIRASVTPVGGPTVPGTFKLDLGGTGTVTLHSPFNRGHGLPGSHAPTIRALGGAGMGGPTVGRIGRLATLQIGDLTLDRPPAMFSTDTSGAYASPEIDGHIGARVASRFRVFLDYARSRIILEPNLTFGASFDRVSTGMALEADGSDYRIFRVTDVLEDGPAAAAGLQRGDVISTMDGRGAAALTLGDVIRRLETPEPCPLTIVRGGASRQVLVTPRVLLK